MKRLTFLALTTLLMASCGSDDKNAGAAPVIEIDQINPIGKPEIGQTSKSLDQNISRQTFGWDQNTNEEYKCFYEEQYTEKTVIGYESDDKIIVYQKAKSQGLDKAKSDSRCEETVEDVEDIYTTSVKKAILNLNQFASMKDDFSTECKSDCRLIIKQREDGSAFMEITGRTDEPGSPLYTYKAEFNVISPWLEVFKGTSEYTNSNASAQNETSNTTLGKIADMSSFPFVTPQDVTSEILPKLMNKEFGSPYVNIDYKMTTENGRNVLIDHGLRKGWNQDTSTEFDCYVTYKKYIKNIEKNTLKVQKGDLDSDVYSFILSTYSTIVDANKTPSANLKKCQDYFGSYSHDYQEDSQYRYSHFKIIDDDNFLIDIDKDYSGLRITVK